MVKESKKKATKTLLALNNVRNDLDKISKKNKEISEDMEKLLKDKPNLEENLVD